MPDAELKEKSGHRWGRLRTAFRFGATFWLAAALLLVFSLPHVIALRSFLLFVLLIVVFGDLRGIQQMLVRYDVRIVSIALGALLVWMLCVAFFIAPEPTSSLRDFAGEWGRAPLAMVVGCGVALAIGRRSGDQLSSLVVTLIFFASCLHVFAHDIAALFKWVEIGLLPSHFAGITDHKWNVTHVFALLLSAMGADICSRYVFGRPLMIVGVSTLGAAAILGLFALLTASSTNGWIVAILLTLFIVTLASSMTLRRMDGTHSRLKPKATIVLGIAFAALGVLAIENDPRYDGFLESVAIGWDTENTRNWLDADYTRNFPVRANGVSVDASTYSRVAFAKEGFKLLLEHPLGTEIGKDTFTRLIAQKYGVARMGHSHIGLIDLGLNVGFLGIALWLIFLAGLAWIGWFTTKRSGDAVGLCLLFLVTGFSMRMMIDSILRDHMLEQFMFCTGMLLVACVWPRSQEGLARGK